MVEHVNITDAERHEPKGASTATNNQVLKSNGDGSTSFVNPVTLDNISFVSTISNSNSSIIAPSVVDTAIVAGFDSTVSNSDITMDSSGLITINTTGIYSISFNMNFGRTTNTGTAIILARLVINTSQFGFTEGVSLSSNDNNRPVRIDLDLSLQATDTLKVEIMRDSSGNNDGGLHPIPVTDATWVDVPSHFIRVSRIDGAV